MTERLEARWTIRLTRPSDWDQTIARVDAGYFCSPPALTTSAPAGEPVFARLEGSDGVLGAALGVRTACRLGRRPSHYYFPTPPRLLPEVRQAPSVRLLLDSLRSAGASHVVVDAFDAGADPEWPEPTRRRRCRLEFRLELSEPPDRLLGHFSTTHRRNIRRGEREGWTLRPLPPQEGGRALHTVLTLAAQRATSRGERMVVPPEAELRHPALDFSAASGTCTFGAFHGSDLLSAALTGWGGRGVVYLMGGSTEMGYRSGAAPWLHWRVMQLARAAGLSRYSLGGTPAAAAEAENESHGLYRFKLGFAPQIVRCSGAEWEFRPFHQRMHRMLHGLASVAEGLA